jgi:uncharacterized protein (TIGR03083 family)
MVSAAAVPLDLPATRAALEAVGRRLVRLLEAVPDPQAPTRGLAWTLGETSLHLAGGPARYADFARGRALPEPTVDLGPVFAQRMAAQPERTPSVLARQLEANTHRYLAETAELPATHPVPFFGGVTIELAAQSAILLGEFVVHGDDVARSLGRPWPIDPAHARLIVAAITALLPRYVDRTHAGGLTATYQVRLRGGPSFQVRFDRGTATVAPAQPGPADCRVTADAVTFLLVVYGRRSQWPGILRGQLRAWGRRPWLGPRFQRLFVRP